MPDEEIQKLYYSIGEVSEIIGQEPHVLRYWETEFDELSPRKNRAGRRVYTEDDIKTVERIQYLLKDEKYTIAGAQQVLARDDDEERAREEALKGDMKKLRGFLVDVLQKL